MTIGSVPQIMRCIMVTHPSSELFNKSMGHTDWWYEDISNYVPKSVRSVILSGMRITGAGQLQLRMWEDVDSFILIADTGSHKRLINCHVAYDMTTGLPLRRLMFKQTQAEDVFQLKIYGYYVDGIKGGSTLG